MYGALKSDYARAKREGIVRKFFRIAAIAAAAILVGTDVQAAPPVPSRCAPSWAKYSHTPGEPITPGTFELSGFQYPSQTLTIQIYSIQGGVVKGHERYFGDNGATSWDKGGDFRGRVIGPDTFTWVNPAGSRLVAKSVHGGLGGFIDSELHGACNGFFIPRTQR